MRLVPVLDVKQGIVVRGVGGRRSEYQPLESRLTSSCQPLDVARAFQEHYGFCELYLADLDALAGAPPAWELFELLGKDGFQIWVDAGVHVAKDIHQLKETNPHGIILGLETLAGPEVLEEVKALQPTTRFLFSLDLREGIPLGNRTAWQGNDAEGIVRQVVAQGVRELLVLDLARVGMGAGTGTEALCRTIRAAHPGCTLWAGGGIRNTSDLECLERAGVEVALVASFLHDAAIRIR